MSGPDEPSPPPSGQRQRTIPVTCRVHSGAAGFCNLRVSKVDGDIVLDPHVTGACVIVLNEEAATALTGTIVEWLG